MDPNDVLLLTPEVEKMILPSASGNGNALHVARHRGSIDIPVVRVGKRGIRYRRSDVLTWLARNTITPKAPKVKPKRRTRAKRWQQKKGGV